MESITHLFESLENVPLILALSTLISEDLAYIYGLFSFQSKKLTGLWFILAYTIGVTVGDLMLYYIGFFAGKYRDNKFIQKLYKRFIPNNDNNENKNEFGLFEEFLAFTRFIPGSRIPTYTYCGLTKYPVYKFVSILFVTSIIYSSFGLLLVKSVIITKDYELSLSQRIIISLTSGFGTIFFFKLLILARKLKLKYGKVIKPMNRLITRSRYLEFWPSFLFYLPFVPVFIWYMIRYRGIKAVLCANPSLHMSGFIGELKSDIDELLIKDVPWARLKTFSVSEKNLDSVLELMQLNNLSFPIVIKPDSGMRGTDVFIVENKEKLKLALEHSHKAVILQEFCPYTDEWGVYYYRVPGEKNGKIFSVTKKQKPFVIGDGKSKLLDLVLKDHYIGNRFDWIFKECELAPDSIPKLNEKVNLVKKGSHSKGCLFLDGADTLKTGVLNSVTETLDNIDGFFIGRVDVKFDSVEELKAGAFKIVEINGVGGESSNFYDPSIPWYKVYSIMIKQWALIFKIGDMNRKLGVNNKENAWTLLKEAFSYK